MATQRLTVATFAGQSAVAVTALFKRWRAAPDAAEVDRLCAALREHALSLPFSTSPSGWTLSLLGQADEPGAAPACGGGGI